MRAGIRVIKKPISKAREPKMKRLNQDRDSGHDKKEMSRSNAMTMI